jgi:Leucine-rich repeat (LRR) protein
MQCLVANELLTWLSVKSNALKTLQPLSEHGKLAVLNAAHNQLADVEGLRASAPQLKALILNNNKLSELKCVGWGVVGRRSFG